MRDTITFIYLIERAGGIELQAESVYNEIVANEKKLIVLYPEQDKKLSVFQGTSINPVYGAGNIYLNAVFLYKYARRNRKDIFMIYNVGPVYMLTLWLAGVKKIIYSIRGSKYWENRKQKVSRLILWRLASVAKPIYVSNSMYSRKLFVELIDKYSDPIVLYNPVDKQRFTVKKRGYPRHPRKIVYAGRLVEGKNLFNWIDVVERLSTKNSLLEFYIYGEGPLRKELQIYIENKQLERVVTLHGYRKDIETVLSESDLLLFLSEYESFGNIVVESILVGTPVLCSNIPSMREIFNGYFELTIDMEGDFYKEIENKMDNYGRLVEITRSCQEEFRMRFGIENYIKGISNIMSNF